MIKRHTICEQAKVKANRSFRPTFSRPFLLLNSQTRIRQDHTIPVFARMTIAVFRDFGQLASAAATHSENRELAKVYKFSVNFELLTSKSESLNSKWKLGFRLLPDARSNFSSKIFRAAARQNEARSTRSAKNWSERCAVWHTEFKAPHERFRQPARAIHNFGRRAKQEEEETKKTLSGWLARFKSVAARQSRERKKDCATVSFQSVGRAKPDKRIFALRWRTTN